MRRPGGFSLLEVLAALALLALVLLGVYGALATIIRSARSSMELTQRLDEVRAAQGYLRQTLTQSLAYPWASDAHNRFIVFSGDSTHMNFVAPAPGYLQTQGVQLQQLRLLEEKGHYRLEVVFSPLASRHPAAVVPGEPEVLVSDIREGRFRYADRGGDNHSLRWLDHWDHPGTLPDMVSIDLKLSSGQPWPSVDVPLRMDAGATNVREGMYRLSLNQAGP